MERLDPAHSEAHEDPEEELGLREHVTK